MGALPHDIMKSPTMQRSSVKKVGDVAENNDFVTIDLDSYEKEVGVCEGAGQVESKPAAKGQKTRLIILVLSLVFLGLASLIVALVFLLVRRQKL